MSTGDPAAQEYGDGWEDVLYREEEEVEYLESHFTEPQVVQRPRASCIYHSVLVQRISCAM